MKKTAALLLVLLTLLGAGYLWTLPSHNEQAVRVDIRPGASLTAMAQRWQDDGWLPSALLLKIQARLLGKQQVLRVGEFDIPPRLTGPQLLAFLAEARPVSYRLSFIEGTTLREAIQTLQQAPRLKPGCGTTDSQPDCQGAGNSRQSGRLVVPGHVYLPQW